MILVAQRLGNKAEKTRLLPNADFVWTGGPYIFQIKEKSYTVWCRIFALVTPTRIELVSPPWKGDVLTSWPRGLMVAVVGFEPTTCRVWTGRSGQLSYTATESHQTYQAWSIWQERLTILSYLGTFVNYFFKKNLTVLAVWIFKPQKGLSQNYSKK